MKIRARTKNSSNPPRGLGRSLSLPHHITATPWPILRTIYEKPRDLLSSSPSLIDLLYGQNNTNMVGLPLSMDSLNIPQMGGTNGGGENNGDSSANLGVMGKIKTSWKQYLDYCNSLIEWYQQQTITKKIVLAIVAALLLVAVVLLAIFHVYIIKFLIFLSDKWQLLKFGRLLLFTLIFFVGFPPLLGFSALSILSGMVYGLVGGWILLASASISGSFCSFLVFRYLLRSKAESLLKSNEKFRAFAEILKEDQSLLLLVLIRLCPLPYSLSNGALASIPQLSPTTYLTASIITSPKLFIHIFVGHQLKDIGDDTNTTLKRVLDGISIFITALASATTTYVIYIKMQQRLLKYHLLDNPYGDNGDYNELIFGNFNDDESGNNLELNSTDFDTDNFIIDDEDDHSQDNKSSSLKLVTNESVNSIDTDSPDGTQEQPLEQDIAGDNNSRPYRDY